MAVLPSYVQVLIDGYGEEFESLISVTEFEAGPAKHLQTKSLGMVRRPAKLKVPGADYVAFKTWFKTSLNGGGAWFDFDDPVDGVTKSARFFKGQLGGATPTTSYLGTWIVECVIETRG